jgi:hypothetical protein
MKPLVKLIAFVFGSLLLALMFDNPTLATRCLSVFVIFAGAGLIWLGWEIAHSPLVDEFGREIEED